MDLNQTQLIKSEWESIEIPSSESEIKILQLIKNGFLNPNISVNYHLSLLSFLKVEATEVMFEFLFTKYLKPKVDSLIKDNSLTSKVVLSKKTTIKSADKIRIQQNETLMAKQPIYEFVLLDYMEKLLKNKKDRKWMVLYYTLIKLINYKIHKLKQILIQYIRFAFDKSN